MDHSDYGIEAPPVDRNSTMPGLSEQGHQFVKAGAFLYGDDVRAGNGNVVHCMFAKMEEIFEHLALNRRQIAIAGDSAVLFLIIFVDGVFRLLAKGMRSEEHTSELQSLMRISYAVFCLKK